MKNQALFSLKDKSKKLKCHLLQLWSGTLRVNILLLVHKCRFLRLNSSSESVMSDFSVPDIEDFNIIWHIMWHLIKV